MLSRIRLSTDFFAPYWHLDVTHAVCGAHLSRELVAAAEVDGQEGWAVPMERLLAEINRVAHRARDAGGTDFAPALVEKYRRRHDDLIKAGWTANPDHQPGRHAKKRPKHVNLPGRLDSHREEVLRYATDLRVPFTNQWLRTRHPAPEDQDESLRRAAHHGRRPSILPPALLPLHRRQTRPISLHCNDHAPQRQPLATSH